MKALTPAGTIVALVGGTYHGNFTTIRSRASDALLLVYGLSITWRNLQAISMKN
jgi:hypothetical protein